MRFLTKLVEEAVQKRLQTLTEALQDVELRVQIIERAETDRELAVADSLDKVRRWLKRIAQRDRDNAETEDAGESPLSLRNRLRGR